ncbi:hypothetical protein AVEN_58582-1 [Araneus ventricosus]|uniref:Uncharacterized protein n=1 Tax=Araneus ventricosus TaxID=182803 RepID=A0A4Y2GVW6_ARAVE|nr:hypothetical protein AVEN_58582-1 [Araneus ventricosus]
MVEGSPWWAGAALESGRRGGRSTRQRRHDLLYGGRNAMKFGLKFPPDLYLSTCWIPRCVKGVQKFFRGGHPGSPTGAIPTGGEDFEKG